MGCWIRVGQWKSIYLHLFFLISFVSGSAPCRYPENAYYGK